MSPSHLEAMLDRIDTNGLTLLCMMSGISDVLLLHDDIPHLGLGC